jgi:hypothetical protein
VWQALQETLTAKPRPSCTMRIGNSKLLLGSCPCFSQRTAIGLREDLELQQQHLLAQVLLLANEHIHMVRCSQPATSTILFSTIQISSRTLEAWESRRGSFLPIPFFYSIWAKIHIRI